MNLFFGDHTWQNDQRSIYEEKIVLKKLNCRISKESSWDLIYWNLLAKETFFKKVSGWWKVTEKLKYSKLELFKYKTMIKPWENMVSCHGLPWEFLKIISQYKKCRNWQEKSEVNKNTTAWCDSKFYLQIAKQERWKT